MKERQPIICISGKHEECNLCKWLKFHTFPTINLYIEGIYPQDQVYGNGVPPAAVQYNMFGKVNWVQEMCLNKHAGIMEISGAFQVFIPNEIHISLQSISCICMYGMTLTRVPVFCLTIYTSSFI